jgi:hypothetical protein
MLGYESALRSLRGRATLIPCVTFRVSDALKPLANLRARDDPRFRAAMQEFLVTPAVFTPAPSS